MNSNRAINVGVSSSLVDLKAELIRKQQELRSAKSRDSRGGAVKTAKKSDILRSKSKEAGSNKGVAVRSQKDRLRIAEEERTEAKSKSVLEAKAKLYEKMQKAALVMDSDDEDEASEASKLFSQSLVNFKQKAIDDIEEKKRIMLEEEEKKAAAEHPYEVDEDEWTEFTDALGRTRRCLKSDLPSFIDTNEALSRPENPGICLSASADDRLREMKREKWELEAELLAAKDKVHYQDVLFDEVRTHGAGYYKFSTDEETRAQQMRDLKKLSEETKASKMKLKKEKKGKKDALKERLRKIKNKKRAKAGLPPLPESEDDDSEEEEEKEEDTNDDEPDKTDLKKPEIRAWDYGKAGVFAPKPTTFDELDEQWLRNRRSDRNPDFAPPSSLYSEGGLKKHYNRSCQGPPPQNISAKYSNFVKSKDSTPSSSSAASSSSTPVVIEPPPKPFQVPQNFWKQRKDKQYESRIPPQKPIPINDEMPAPVSESSEEFDRGRGTEIAPPATFDYYHGDKPKRGGRVNFADPNEVKDAVESGLKTLREQFERKRKDDREGQHF